MNLGDAYGMPYATSDWTATPLCNKYTDIDEAFEDMKHLRGMELPIGNAHLEPCSIDAEKMASSYRKYQEEHRAFKQEYDSLEKKLKDANDLYTKLTNTAREFHEMIGRFQLDTEDTKNAVDTYQVYEQHCEKINKAIKTSLEAQLKTQCEKMSGIEDNMAAMRKCITLGLQLVLGEKEMKASLCPVCFDAEVNMVLIPCGHTACSSCIQKLTDTCCMTCRRKFTNKNALYFS